MITDVQLTDAGTTRMSAWLANVAAPAVRYETVMIEACRMAAERAETGETLVYELGRQYTITGRPETITLARGDFDISSEDDAQD